MTGFGAITSDRLSLARRRWQAAYAAEVDYSATDQYEQLGACLQALKRSSCCSANSPIRKSSREVYFDGRVNVNRGRVKKLDTGRGGLAQEQGEPRACQH